MCGGARVGVWRCEVSRRPERPRGGRSHRLARIGPALAGRPAGILAVVVATAAFTCVAVAAVPEATRVADRVASARATVGLGRQETSRILSGEHGRAAHLHPAASAPAPAPAALADSPPMVPGEVFAFAPYWTLDQQASFDLTGIDTVSYFGLGVNANGTLQESGTGWTGYQSQELGDLVTRAHDGGTRVVLTVECFSQGALDQLTSSPSAASTLARQVVTAMKAKNLDGVNLDLEGTGPTDAAGLTRLVAAVSRAVHGVNPDDQVTVDTYASAAAGAGSFYDIPALAKVVNGFFVMAYDLNLSAGTTPRAPVTSTQFPDSVAATEYAAAVPPSMVIFGASFYGYSWPTTNGSLAAHPMGTPVPVSFGQVVASGHPMYWDPVTDTAWTSYEVGNQWYEAYFEDPASLRMVAALARSHGFGTGVWALGMQGGDPAMLAAIEGKTPGTGVPPLGPAVTSTSGAGGGPPTTTPAASTTTTTPRPTESTADGPSTTTSTTNAGPPAYRYSGVWSGQTVPLQRVSVSRQPATSDPVPDGTLSDFVTTDPSVACLQTTPHPMTVLLYAGADEYVAVARATTTQCATADFAFPASAVPPATPGSQTQGGG